MVLPELWYKVEGGERKKNVGYRAVCHSKEEGVPCGWMGEVCLEQIDASRYVEEHVRESRQVWPDESWSVHVVHVEKLVEP